MEKTTPPRPLWMMSELEPLLVRYQRDPADDSVVPAVVRALQQQQQKQSQTDDRDDDDDDDDDAEDATAVLLRRILDCAAAAVDGGGGGASLEAARALIQLVVQVTASLVLSQNNSNTSCDDDSNATAIIVQSVLERLIQFAGCQSDRVRAAAVEHLGPLVEAVTQQMAAPLIAAEDGDRPQQDQDRSDDDDPQQQEQQQRQQQWLDRLHGWLDRLQQAVVRAVTDRAAAVRAAAIAAAAGFGDRDPDVQQGLLWLLQHDPSAPNRAKAASAVAVNLSTVTALACRVRDAKSAVRVAALERLAGAPEATIVDAAAASSNGSDSDSSSNSEDAQQSRHRPALLRSHHLVAILRACVATDRCEATRAAARRLLLRQWLPQCRYNPLRLLRAIGCSQQPGAAAAAVGALLEAAAGSSSSSSNLLEEEEDWSQAEMAALREGLEKALDFGIQDLRPLNSDGNACDYPVERLFWARSVLASQHNFNGSGSNTSKELLFQKLVPDIPALVQVLEGFVTQLVQTLAAAAADDDNDIDQDANEEKEETLVCLCTQLLQLATLQASSTTASLEEGSRRVLRDAMKRLLQTIWTPDAVVEPCVQTLRAVVTEEAQFCDCVCEIVAHLDTEQEVPDDDDDEARQALQANFASLRRLSILSVVLETVHRPSLRHVEHFADAIVPLAEAVVAQDNNNNNNNNAGEENNPLVSEAAISCLGKLGLFSSPATVRDDYMPIMLQTALDDHQERMEVRAQAMLAVCDWSLLFANTADVDASFRDLVGRFMSDEASASSSSPGTVCIAAEIAAKLLLAGKVCDSDWLAALVAIFFGDAASGRDEDEPDDDDCDVTEVGNPVRLQQLLSVFFPAAVVQSKTLRDALTGCVGSLLQRACEDKKLKKNLPKMLDFVVSTAEQGRLAAEQQRRQQLQPKEAVDENDAEEEKDEDDNAVEPESSPGLLVAVQVATFLSERASDLNTTTLRALCKVVGTVHLVIEDELYEHLSLLKELLEELGNVIDDGTCLRSLTSVTEQLAEVEMEEEVDDDDEEEDDEEQEVSDEPPSPAKENKIVPPDSSDNGGEDSDDDYGDDDATTVVKGGGGRTSLADSVSSRRSRSSRRRLRPTN